MRDRALRLLAQFRALSRWAWGGLPEAGTLPGAQAGTSSGGIDSGGGGSGGAVLLESYSLTLDPGAYVTANGGSSSAPGSPT